VNADELRVLAQRHGWAFPVRDSGGRVRIEPVSDVLTLILLHQWQTEFTWAPKCKRSNDC
jgi:hypothetical protein